MKLTKGLDEAHLEATTIDFRDKLETKA